MVSTHFIHKHKEVKTDTPKTPNQPAPIHTVAQYNAQLPERVRQTAERLRLIEGIKSMPPDRRQQYEPWVIFLEKYPKEYPRLKRDMARMGVDVRTLMAPEMPKP